MIIGIITLDREEDYMAYVFMTLIKVQADASCIVIHIFDRNCSLNVKVSAHLRSHKENISH